jgi:drug/metabolite transporter (DMT)-like permease
MSRLQANLLLLIVACLWGCGNVAQKTILLDIDAFSAAGMRSLIGGLLVAPLLLVFKEQALARQGWWLSLFRVASLFALALILQQIAYLDSSVTNASFLVNTDVVITPVFAWLLMGARPSGGTYLAVALMFAGLFLMSGGGLTGIGMGDLMALLSAAVYALWMVELERHMRLFGRPIATSVAQFLGAALVALPLGIMGGTMTSHTLYGAMPELVMLGAFSTALGFGLMTAAQRFTTASHAAIIVGAECVFGALAAFLLLDERPTAAALAGGALICVAIGVVALAGRNTQTVPVVVQS